jgi:hypothetical protein
VLQGAGRVQAQVVAVHRDVQGPDRDRGALDGGDPGGQPVGQRDTAGRDAEQDEPAGTLVALEDLVGDAGQCAGDVGRFENGPPGWGSAHGTHGAGADGGGRHPPTDLLPRLTGRVVKGWARSAVTVAVADPRQR